MRVVLPHRGLGLNRPWFECDNGRRLTRDRELVAEHYPQLVYYVDEQYVRLQGLLLLGSNSGITTRVAVRIVFPDGYPRHEPIAYDDEHQFPEGLDRHLLRGGRCCLWLPPRSRWKPGHPGALLLFLDEVAVFFDRQLVYDATGRKMWPGGSYSHDHDGYVEFLQETLALDGPKLFALAPILLDRVRPERKDRCPCGSGRKFKRCHALGIWRIQQTIPLDLLAAILCRG